MERTALPVRLVVAFNKVEIKVIAKKMLSTILSLLQSIIRVRRLAAVERHALPTRRGGAHGASGAFGCGF